MKTLVNLPSGGLVQYSKVNMELMLTGEQHDKFLVSSPAQFERAVASILQESMDENIYKISLPDLTYLFFLVRATSVSRTIDVPWTCTNKIETFINGSKKIVECKKENIYIESIKDMKCFIIPPKFKYPVRDIMMNKEGTEIAKVFIKLLTVEEELCLIDYFLNQGLSKEQFLSGDTMSSDNRKYTFAYINRKMATSLTFEDPKYSSLTVEEKEDIVLKYNSAILKLDLYQDMKELNKIGFDLNDRIFTCKECGGKSKFRLPFSLEFLLPQRT